MKHPKVKDLTDRQIYNNLMAWYNRSGGDEIIEGNRWYAEAHTIARDLAAQYLGTTLDTYTVAAVISALSPNNKWARNIQDATNLIKAFYNDESIDSVSVCTYGANKRKAWDILDRRAELTVGSPKTHAFAMVIGLGSESHVVVDRWHIRACLTKPNNVTGFTHTQNTVTPAQYRRIEAITVKLARKLSLPAHAVQATIWVTIRNFKGE